METFWPEVAARDRCCGLMPSRLHELLDGLLRQKRASARLTGHVEDEFNVLKLGSPACDGLNDKNWSAETLRTMIMKKTSNMVWMKLGTT